MILPSLTTIIAMYAAATGLLWIATRILAPEGRKITVLRCFAVAFVLTFLGNASRKFLVPIIGDWVYLISLVLYILLVMGLFRLSLWRSILVTLIYYVGIFTFYYFMARASQ
jgi:hypothetical protein